MSNFEDQDNVESMDRKDTANKLPVGWVILFVGLIIWGIYYLIAYTPSISGWTQYKAFVESVQDK